MVRLRGATHADLDALERIERVANSSPWTRQHFIDEMQREVAKLLVAVAEDQIVGFLAYWVVAGEAEILNIAIDPTCRRAGIASALLHDMLSAPQETPLDAVFLEVRASNGGALGFYAHHGFQRCGVRARYYRDPVEDAVLMRRTI